MIKLIAFDFDGTIADSVDFCFEVYDRVFEKYMGDAAPTREEIYSHFGMNEPGMIRLFLKKIVPEAEQDYFRWHKELHPEYCPGPFPGIPELFAFLKRKGIRIALLTGRSEETCRITMEYFGMESWFESVQTGSPIKNDKAAQLRELLQRNGLKPEELMYVGDTVSDAEASREAGVKCFSAAWGSFVCLEELKAVNPGMVFETIPAMQAWLEEHT